MHHLSDNLTPSSSTSSLQSRERIGQIEISGKSQCQSSYTPSIHIIDDDSLLIIFYLYRPAIFDGDEEDWLRFIGGRGWDRERWWYQLAQVCRRWRDLILRSASYLGLCLVCTYGTPIADMLAHSPPLPLIIEYNDEDRKIAAEDEDEIVLALEQRERVRRIRLRLPVPNMQRFITVVDGEYPILEYVTIAAPNEVNDASLMLTETFQAPHLRHIFLRGVAIPIGSQLLTTSVGLVTLYLAMNHPSAYLQPNTLLHWISFMSQLEILAVVFAFPVLSHDVEMQLIRTPITTHATLLNLLILVLRGNSAYMEAVVRHITIPRLQTLGIGFSNQITFSMIPCLLQFMNTTESLRLGRAMFLFYDSHVSLVTDPNEEAKRPALAIELKCSCFHMQVSSAARISNALSQKFSTVKHLALKHEAYSRLSEEHNEVERIEWRNLLRSFNNVNTLHIFDGLVGKLSRCLRSDNGELPLELLPELQELIFPKSSAVGDPFTQFIDARKNAGRPVTLTRG